MGGGIGSVDTALEALLDDAHDEVLVVIYAIGYGGVAFLNRLMATASRGVRIVVIVNRFSEQPDEVKGTLHRLARDYVWCDVLDFAPADPEEELHAKAVVADRSRAIVGSANLSRRGLLTNYELAVVLEDEAARDVARAIDALRQDPRLVRPVPTP